MSKRGLLKVLGITLFFLTILFFLADKTSFGSMTQASIAFLNINKSISDANYLQWEIESSQDFMLSIRIEDIHGNIMTISFGPNNDNSWDYEVDEEVDYLMVAFPINKRIYEPESFEDMITLFLSEDDDSAFELTDEAIIKRIQIGGNDFKLYSITLADNEDFDDPCWRKKAADWSNLNDFKSDGGDVGLDTGIQFYNSYIQVTRVVGNSPFSPYYPPGYMGNIYPIGGGYGPYNYAYGSPFSGFGTFGGYGYGTPFNGFGTFGGYGYGNPFSGYGPFVGYGYGYPYSAFGTSSGYGYGTPFNGFGTSGGYGYGYPFTGYGYTPYGNPYGGYLGSPYNGVYFGIPYPGFGSDGYGNPNAVFY